jgi:hypothetical protein
MEKRPFQRLTLRCIRHWPRTSAVSPDIKAKEEAALEVVQWRYPAQ